MSLLQIDLRSATTNAPVGAVALDPGESLIVPLDWGDLDMSGAAVSVKVKQKTRVLYTAVLEDPAMLSILPAATVSWPERHNLSCEVWRTKGAEEAQVGRFPIQVGGE